MIGLYRIFTSLVYGLSYPYGRICAARGNDIWRARLGLTERQPVDIWLHAASVGEVKVIGHLMQHLHRTRPNLKMALTTMTSQGYATAKDMLNGIAEIGYFPFDTSGNMHRAIQQMLPRLIVIAETEIWPNLIVEAERKGIPVVQVNGRLSERAFRRYLKIRKSLGRLLNTYDRLFVKSEPDRDRFLALGVPADSLCVTWDMKFDAPLLAKTSLELATLRSEVGIVESDFLLVAGSTRPGEEEALLQVYRRVKAKHPRFRLLLAPRHLVRLPEVEALIDSFGEPHYRFGDAQPPPNAAESRGIVIVDRMGILNDLYGTADMAFVGGTLVDIGGHNILEPVWARTPVVFGPSLSNVLDAAEYVESNNYGTRVESATHLAELVEAVLNGQRGFAVKDEIDLHQSATAIAGNYILERLGDA